MVTIGQDSPAQPRRFAFRAARPSTHDDGPRSDGVAGDPRTLLVTDQRPDPAAILDQADMRGSAPFLAGAIAQARPSPVLHNPPYREVAGAYRRSDRLVSGNARAGDRSDEKV